MFVNGKTKVITYFNPISTQYLHIEDARIAYLNRIYANKYEGSLIACLPEEEKITEGLEYVNYPHIPYELKYVNRPDEYYVKIVEHLIKSGKAYPDSGTFLTNDKIYKGFYRNLDAETSWNIYLTKQSPIRLKLGFNRIVLDDLFMGNKEWEEENISDPILLYKDKIPSHILINAVNYNECNVSHVIKTQEHINESLGELLLCEACNFTPPFFAHVPGWLNKNNNPCEYSDYSNSLTGDIVKKTKSLNVSYNDLMTNPAMRPCSIEFYKLLGYHSEVFINFIMRDIKDVLFEKRTTIEKNWELKKTNQPIFDLNRIDNFSFFYSKTLSEEQRITGIEKYLNLAGISIPRETIKQILTKFSPIMQVDSDILINDFLFRLPTLDLDKVASYLTKHLEKHICEFANILENIQSFTNENILKSFNDFCDKKKIRTIELSTLLRIIIIGRFKTINLFDVMSFIGKRDCLKRIDTFLDEIVLLKK